METLQIENLQSIHFPSIYFSLTTTVQMLQVTGAQCQMSMKRFTQWTIWHLPAPLSLSYVLKIIMDSPPLLPCLKLVKQMSCKQFFFSNLADIPHSTALSGIGTLKNQANSLIFVYSGKKIVIGNCISGIQINGNCIHGAPCKYQAAQKKTILMKNQSAKCFLFELWKYQVVQYFLI